MDKRRSILNVGTSILSKFILLIAAFVARRLLIQQIGNDVNGLNSLYTSIIGMLSVTELGVGQAIVYSMYRPIIHGDRKQTAALYALNRRLYLIIGAVILGGGLCVTPFLPRMISDYQGLRENVYVTFLLTLAAVVLSYAYNARMSLIEAYKDHYIVTMITTVSRMVRYCLQIVTILIWKSFTIFLICQILETIMIWGLTNRYTRRKYGDILRAHESVAPETRKEIARNVKAMVMHKIGSIMVNSIDSIIISGYIGVAVLGRYSNYTYIAGVMVGIITLFFTPLTAVVGHLCAEGDKARSQGYFQRFYSMNYGLGVVFFLGYYAVIDQAVALIFGAGLAVSRAVAFIITANQFIQYMRNAALLFRDASGTFYHDRWKPLAEGLANLILSLLFVTIFPEELRIVGVIAATILTNLLICDTVEPYVVFRHVFGTTPRAFYRRNYAYIALFLAALGGMTVLTRETGSPVTGILLNGAISLGVSAVTLGAAMLADRQLRDDAAAAFRKAAGWIKRRGR